MIISDPINTEFEDIIDKFNGLIASSHEQDCKLDRLAKESKLGFLDRAYFYIGSHILPIFWHWPISCSRHQRNTDKNNYAIESYSLRFYNPFQTIVKCPWKIILVYTFCLYGTIKNLIIVLTYFAHEYKLCAWNKYIDEKKSLNDNQADKFVSNNCINEQILDLEGKNLIDSLNNLNRLHFYIGSPVITNNVLYTFIVLLVLSLGWCILILGFFNWNNPHFRQDSLTLQYEPLMEKKRIAIMASKISSLLQQHQYNQIVYQNGKQPMTNDFRLIVYNLLLEYRLFKRSFPINMMLLEKCCNFESLNINQYGILANWFGKNLSSLDDQADNNYETEKIVNYWQSNTINHGPFKLISPINPAHLTVDNYHKLINSKMKFTICNIIMSALIFSTIVIGLLWRELDNRVLLRNQQLYCKNISISLRSNINLLSRNWPGQLWPEPTNNMNYHEQPTTILNELIAMLNKQTLLTLLEDSMLFTLQSMLLGIYFNLISSNRFLHNIWTMQIIEQLKLIRKLMLLAEITGKQSNSISKQLYEKQLERIQICLSQAYLNFVLFTRNLRYPHAFFKFVALHIAMNAIFGSLSAYICIGRIDENNLILIWIIMIFIAGLLNLIGYLSVNTTKYFNTLSVYINQVCGESTRLSQMRSVHVLSLWRRQILSSNVIEQVFGIELFGVRFSPANLIIFDSRVLATSLYLLKSYM